MDLSRAAQALFASPSRAFPVRLWDGALLPPSHDVGLRACLALKSERALEALLPPASERQLSEAFLDGDIELEGDAIALLEAAALWDGPRPSRSLVPALLTIALRRGKVRVRRSSSAATLSGRVHSLARDRQAVRRHYDVSDDFYRLFLDPGLVYSCAYFRSGGESLEEAQRAKLDLICRKLGLSSGERLLDIGCGWGALLEHAVAHFHVDGLGITLSENQLAEARRRLAQASPPAPAAVLLADYRRVPAGRGFDKVVSVGMMEHVGRSRLDEYFSIVYRLMPSGGLFLNHAIADVSPGVTTLPWANRRGGGFIAHHIFPDSDLVPLGLTIRAAERAGFEVRDVESWREHYAETLACWLGRLERRMAEAAALVGSRVARAYRLYLASSAAAFRLGRISVFQVLLAKRSRTGRAEGVPRSRAAWYDPAPRDARLEAGR